MSDSVCDLIEVVDAVSIDSATRYRIAGSRFRVRIAASSDERSAESGEAHPAVEALHHDIYTYLYCRSSPRGGRTMERVGARVADLALAAALSQANAVRETAESDFYLAIGDGEERSKRDGSSAAGEEGRLIRLYWNVGSQGAIALIRTVTSAWNRIGIPFRAKVVNSESGYPRADTGVIYLDKRYVSCTKAALPVIYGEMRRFVQPKVPRFTKRLAPGLGLAEDPAGDESFGQHRCRVVAEVLWQCFQEGLTGAKKRLSRLTARFSELGFDPHKLYLQPGSRDDYAPLVDVDVDVAAAAAPGKVMK